MSPAKQKASCHRKEQGSLKNKICIRKVEKLCNQHIHKAQGSNGQKNHFPPFASVSDARNPDKGKLQQEKCGSKNQKKHHQAERLVLIGIKMQHIIGYIISQITQPAEIADSCDQRCSGINISPKRVRIRQFAMYIISPAKEQKRCIQEIPFDILYCLLQGHKTVSPHSEIFTTVTPHTLAVEPGAGYTGIAATSGEL